MKNKNSLQQKIVNSVFAFETKRLINESIIKICLLLLSLGIILVFGGVIGDIFSENQMGSLLMGELGTIIFEEIPLWIFIAYLIGLGMGSVLIGIVIMNRNLLITKIKSIIFHWRHI